MRIERQFIERLTAAADETDLIPLVAEAVRLEHATIPPYLCAYFTLRAGTNREAAGIIRSVVIDEMLHLTLMANLLNALGGAPMLDDPGFVPNYPSGLPMGIGDHLSIRMRKCSIAQIRDVFMAIEAPEDPIIIRTMAFVGGTTELAAAALPTFSTIGTFYQFLAAKISQLGPGIFVGDPARQVVARRWLAETDEMFAVTDVASALRAIAVIVDQGEGTQTSPFDEDGMPAHFYRFEEIVRGRALVSRPGETPPYAYAGAPVPFDAAAVFDMDDDPSLAKYRERSASRTAAETFAASYTAVLTALHAAFNGTPAAFDHAMGLMYELRLLAQQVLATPAEFAAGAGPQKATGLCFEYRPPA